MDLRSGVNVCANRHDGRTLISFMKHPESSFREGQTVFLKKPFNLGELSPTWSFLSIPAL
jgi:hypothetical protein